MMKDEQGQTSVEYVLLLAVMIFIAIAFFEKVNAFVVDNPDSLMNRYLGGFTRVLGSPATGNNGVDGQYKTFSLPR